MDMVTRLISGVTQGLIDRLGINPDQLKAGFQSTVNDAARVKNEVLAAKQGFINVTSDFKAQLNRIEAQNLAIMRALGIEPILEAIENDGQGKIPERKAG